MPKKSKRIIKKLASLRVALALGAVLVLFGLALLGFQLFSLWRSQQTSAAAQPVGDLLQGSAVDDGHSYTSGIPVRVSVPGVKVDLEVTSGHYYPKSQTWTLTRDKAQWAVMTRPANDQSGMTFIYGHYRRGVFLNLPKVKPGEIAQLKTDNGHTFSYRFRASSVVPPQDTSIFNYQGQPILVLQTCTGVKFENRQLFVFDLEKVE